MFSDVMNVCTPRGARLDDEKFESMDDDFQNWLTGSSEPAKKKKRTSSSDVKDVGGFLGIMDDEKAGKGKLPKAV